MSVTECFPAELWVQVFQHVDLRTACTLRLVNRKLRNMAEDKHLCSIFRQHKICSQHSHGACIRDGDLSMWGYNHCHRLMEHNSTASSRLDVCGQKIRAIVTKSSSTVALTESKDLYLWGHNRLCDPFIHKTPTLLHEKEKFVHVGMSEHEDIAAVSENGVFYYWNQEAGNMSTINIPGDRSAKIFFTPYIMGFATERGILYIANHAPFLSDLYALEDMLCVDWTPQMPLKTLIYWKFGCFAIVLTRNERLCVVSIDEVGERTGTVREISLTVQKALYFENPGRVIYFLTRDGRIGSVDLGNENHPRIKRSHIFSYGKVSVDFDVVQTEEGYKIEMIDEKGEIRQCLQSFR